MNNNELYNKIYLASINPFSSLSEFENHIQRIINIIPIAVDLGWTKIEYGYLNEESAKAIRLAVNTIYFGGGIVLHVYDGKHFNFYPEGAVQHAKWVLTN